MSEKIESQHLQRKAVLYVRQSSSFQVQNNPSQFIISRYCDQFEERLVQLFHFDKIRTEVIESKWQSFCPPPKVGEILEIRNSKKFSD